MTQDTFLIHNIRGLILNGSCLHLSHLPCINIYIFAAQMNKMSFCIIFHHSTDSAYYCCIFRHVIFQTSETVQWKLSTYHPLLTCVKLEQMNCQWMELWTVFRNAEGIMPIENCPEIETGWRERKGNHYIFGSSTSYSEVLCIPSSTQQWFKPMTSTPWTVHSMSLRCSYLTTHAMV